MYIYRIEHPDTHKGPYTHNWNLARNLCEDHQDCTHPDMFADVAECNMWKYTMKGSKFYACFDKIEDLCSWFHGWLRTFAEFDFIMCIYDIPDLIIRRGVYQCMVELEHAKLVDTMSIVDLIVVTGKE